MLLNVGDQAPDFTLLDDEGKAITLSHYRGKKIILYFYPKDHTPGCTQQACDFRDAYAELTSQDTIIIGISKDNVNKHASFKAKYGIPFILLSDIDGKACDLYGIFKQKSMFGRTFLSIQRSTFLIDKAGHIQQIWRKVKVKDHIAEVLNYATSTEI